MARGCWMLTLTRSNVATQQKAVLTRSDRYVCQKKILLTAQKTVHIEFVRLLCRVHDAESADEFKKKEFDDLSQEDKQLIKVQTHFQLCVYVRLLISPAQVILQVKSGARTMKELASIFADQEGSKGVIKPQMQRAEENRETALAILEKATNALLWHSKLKHIELPAAPIPTPPPSPPSQAIRNKNNKKKKKKHAEGADESNVLHHQLEETTRSFHDMVDQVISIPLSKFLRSAVQFHFQDKDEAGQDADEENKEVCV